MKSLDISYSERLTLEEMLDMRTPEQTEVESLRWSMRILHTLDWDLMETDSPKHRTEENGQPMTKVYLQDMTPIYVSDSEIADLQRIYSIPNSPYTMLFTEYLMDYHPQLMEKMKTSGKLYSLMQRISTEMSARESSLTISTDIFTAREMLIQEMWETYLPILGISLTPKEPTEEQSLSCPIDLTNPDPEDLLWVWEKGQLVGYLPIDKPKNR